MKTVRWDCDDIIVEDRARKRIKEKSVLELMKSIQRIGLREPPTIRVRINEDGCGEGILVAGLHRVEACKRLGLSTIDCVEFKGDEIEARLWEIAENLHRAELTPDERDEHIREWGQLTKQADKLTTGGQFLHPERIGGRGNEGGVREFARNFNLPLATVQNALDLGKLDPAVKEQADAAGLNRKEKVRVVRTAGDDPDRQKAKVQELAAHKAEVAARKAEGQRNRKKNETHTHNQQNIVTLIPTEAQYFADWLMERMGQSDFPKVVSWLKKCEPEDVIAAMKRKAA